MSYNQDPGGRPHAGDASAGFVQLILRDVDWWVLHRPFLANWGSCCKQATQRRKHAEYYRTGPRTSLTIAIKSFFTPAPIPHFNAGIAGIAMCVHPTRLGFATVELVRPTLNAAIGPHMPKTRIGPSAICIDVVAVCRLLDR